MRIVYQRILLQGYGWKNVGGLDGLYNEKERKKEIDVFLNVCVYLSTVCLCRCYEFVSMQWFKFMIVVLNSKQGTIAINRRLIWTEPFYHEKNCKLDVIRYFSSSYYQLQQCTTVHFLQSTF